MEPLMGVVMLTIATYTLARTLAYIEQSKIDSQRDAKELERQRQIAALYGKDNQE